MPILKCSCCKNFVHIAEFSSDAKVLMLMAVNPARNTEIGFTMNREELKEFISELDALHSTME